MAEFRDSIEIEAAPEAVFDHLVTADGLTVWLGRNADVDAVPGGRFAADVAGYPVRGEYLVVERPARVVLTWGFAGNDDLPPGASTVEVRLTPTATGTRVDLCHHGLPETEVPGHADGWGHFLPRLARAGTGEDPGPSAWLPAPDLPGDA